MHLTEMEYPPLIVSTTEIFLWSQNINIPSDNPFDATKFQLMSLEIQEIIFIGRQLTNQKDSELQLSQNNSTILDNGS